jgi:hypothetical protein
MRNSIASSLVRFLGVVSALFTIAFAHDANAQIKQPGAHPDYVVELEPHFVWQYGATGNFDSDGIGVGLRASIPVVKNGPVPSINNNFAVTFGLDWAHIDWDCGVSVLGYSPSCTANHFIVPIAAQWNFFFTPVVSAFAELGIGIHHYSEKVSGCNGTVQIAGIGVVGCPYLYGSRNRTEAIPIFAVGPRFILSDIFAITIRVGYPYATLGASFLL